MNWPFDSNLFYSCSIYKVRGLGLGGSNQVISFSFCFSFGCISQISKIDESGKTFFKFPNKDVITSISSLKSRKKRKGRGVRVPDRARLKFVRSHSQAWSIWPNVYTSLW